MSLAIPNLPCSDLRVAREFYETRLGFHVVFASSEDGRTGILGLERDGMRINLDSPMDGHGRRACVTLEVSDLDSLHQEWSAKIRDLEPPLEQIWGARTFGFQDPDDNTVFVVGWRVIEAVSD